MNERKREIEVRVNKKIPQLRDSLSPRKTEASIAQVGMEKSMFVAPLTKFNLAGAIDDLITAGGMW